MELKFKGRVAPIDSAVKFTEDGIALLTLEVPIPPMKELVSMPDYYLKELEITLKVLEKEQKE